MSCTYCGFVLVIEQQPQDLYLQFFHHCEENRGVKASQRRSFIFTLPSIKTWIKHTYGNIYRTTVNEV